MATEIDHSELQSQQEPFVYRALSAAAVSCFAFGLLSLLAFFDWWLVAIPVIGIAIGVHSLQIITKRPDEFTGKILAKFGIIFCAICFVGSCALHTYIYQTEVPEDCRRTHWEELQPDESSQRNTAVPELAKELNGQRIFLKGYIFPVTGGRRKGIQKFLLVRDQGECCFGGDPKMTERIQVTVADSQGAEYTSGVCKVAGTFRINPSQQVEGAQQVKRGVLYHLDEVEIR